MNPVDPKQNPLIPAVEHLMGSLDADAQGVQRVADKLVGALGDSLISDRNYLQKRVKSRIPRMVGNAIRRDERRINDMATPMRQAVASSLAVDVERVDQIAAALPSGLPSLGAPAGATAPTVPSILTSTATAASGNVVCARWTDQYGYVVPGGPYDCSFDDLSCPIYPGGVVAGPYHGAAPPFSIAGLEQYRGMAWCLTLPGWQLGAYKCVEQVGTAPPPSNVPPPPIVVPPPEPAPVPAPAPAPAVQPCGPLPEGLPAVAVYVVPWLDPGDRMPSAPSECGRKLVDDGLWDQYPAADLLAALRSGAATDDYLPDSAGEVYLLGRAE